MATLYSDKIVKRHLFGEAVSYPIRKIGLLDLKEVLRLGWEDFQAMPSHAIVVCVMLQRSRSSLAFACASCTTAVTSSMRFNT